MPVISLNSSPPRCLFEPGPDDANVSAPGFDFASATSSITDFAGTEGCTTRTASVEKAIPTGTKSRIST